MSLVQLIGSRFDVRNVLNSMRTIHKIPNGRTRKYNQQHPLEDVTTNLELTALCLLTHNQCPNPHQSHPQSLQLEPKK
jgi:hypothetical protein